MLEIRTAAPSDEQFLFDMLQLAIFTPPGADPPPASVLDQPAIAHYAAGFGTRRGDVGFVATCDGTPVGAAWARRFPATDPGYGFVAQDIPELTVAVAPAVRNSGLGTRLLETLLTAIGPASLSCDVRNPAMRLYERLGFEVVGTDGTAVVMLRR